MKQIKESKFSNIPEADVVVNHIRYRFRKGLNTNVFVIGLSGTGKSSTSHRLCELVIQQRPDEKLRMICVDSLLGLIDAIRQSKPGDCIIIEEVSVLFPSRRAMGEENLAIAKIFDTVRKKMLCIISNAPLWNSIDKLMKAQGHTLIQTVGIKRIEGIVISKFWRLQTNPATGKCYKHTMMRKGKEIPLMITKKPNKELWDEYERKKDIFMDDLYAKLKHKQVKKKEKEDKDMGKLKPKIRKLTKKELEVHQLCNVEGLTHQKAADKLGLHRTTITRRLQNVTKKSTSLRE